MANGGPRLPWPVRCFVREMITGGQNRRRTSVLVSFVSFGALCGCSPSSASATHGIDVADASSSTARLCPNGTCAKTMTDAGLAADDRADSGNALADHQLSPEARAVLSYIESLSGSGKILSGQQEFEADNEWNGETILSRINEYPAIRGFGIWEDSSLVPAHDPLEEAFASFVQNRTIPTFSWWVPSPAPGVKEKCLWIDRANGEAGACDAWTQPGSIRRALTPGTAEFDGFKASMDNAVLKLGFLASRNVPVLWRPFHEMNAWHPWYGPRGDGLGGVNTAADFQELWRYTFDYLVRVKHLDNLIWVFATNWNGASFADFYPGDSYVEIVGVDAYGSPTNTCSTNTGNPTDASRQYARLKSGYEQLSAAVFGGKPIACAENDYIPDPAQLATDGLQIAWFNTWEWPSLGCNLSSGVLERLYGYPQVITANELRRSLVSEEDAVAASRDL